MLAFYALDAVLGLDDDPVVSVIDVALFPHDTDDIPFLDLEMLYRRVFGPDLRQLVFRHAILLEDLVHLVLLEELMLRNQKMLNLSSVLFSPFLSFNAPDSQNTHHRRS